MRTAVGGFLRVFVTHGNLRDSVAIAASLLLIVLASVLLGTALPFALVKAGVDPAHAGSSIQVGCLPQSRHMHAAVRLGLGLGLDGSKARINDEAEASVPSMTAEEHLIVIRPGTAP